MFAECEEADGRQVQFWEPWRGRRRCWPIFFSVDVLKDIGQVGLGRTPMASSF
jgi:hypothetical protein